MHPFFLSLIFSLSIFGPPKQCSGGPVTLGQVGQMVESWLGPRYSGTSKQAASSTLGGGRAYSVPVGPELLWAVPPSSDILFFGLQFLLLISLINECQVSHALIKVGGRKTLSREKWLAKSLNKWKQLFSGNAKIYSPCSLHHCRCCDHQEWCLAVRPAARPGYAIRPQCLRFILFEQWCTYLLMLLVGLLGATQLFMMLTHTWLHCGWGFSHSVASASFTAPGSPSVAVSW